MTQLVLTPNILGADDIYEQLIGLHEGLTDQESLAANAQLILVLINQIGDTALVTEAIALVRRGVKPRGDLS
ncbi:MAG: mhpA [Caulobacteraceae bacterium]|nr:mhpA [Caulobacteraceae bacterium]